ncbi:MAG: type VI secretion system tube protein Hcp [Planctomycetota bacterium]
MAFDGYLFIEGINGDSTDDAHAEWIEIDGFEHVVQQATGGGGSAQGGHAGGRADHGDFIVHKRLDSSSPALFLHCCKGQSIPEVVVELCRAVGDKTTFMKYTFQNVIVSQVNPKGEAQGEDLIPSELIGFRYSNVMLEYTPTGTDGSTSASIQAGWSTQTNTPL